MSKLKSSREEINEQIAIFRQRAELSFNDEDRERNLRLMATWQRTLTSYESDLIKRRELAFDRRMLDKSPEWLAWAKSLYVIEPIETGWRVRSTAREWREEKYWEVPCRIDADERVEQLVNYKIRDRERGKASGKSDMAVKAKDSETEV